jgi:hypothetical protein
MKELLWASLFTLLRSYDYVYQIILNLNAMPLFNDMMVIHFSSWKSIDHEDIQMEGMTIIDVVKCVFKIVMHFINNNLKFVAMDVPQKYHMIPNLLKCKSV